MLTALSTTENGKIIKLMELERIPGKMPKFTRDSGRAET